MQSISFLLNGSYMQFGNLNDINLFPFLQNEEQTTSLYFHYIYQLLIENIYKDFYTISGELGGRLNIPQLAVSVSFSDVQGKMYYKEMNIVCNTVFATVSPDNSGYAVVDLNIETTQN